MLQSVITLSTFTEKKYLSQSFFNYDFVGDSTLNEVLLSVQMQGTGELQLIHHQLCRGLVYEQLKCLRVKLLLFAGNGEYA